LGLKTIEADLFREMLITSMVLLERSKSTLNDLNVFPVPDGDTGTNMCMTMVSAVKEVKESNGLDSVSKLADELSMGALRGARGNSGVILSQIIRGFAKGVHGKDVLDTTDFAEALASATKTAYKAVMKPKEGTILTIIRSLSEAAQQQVNTGNDDFYTLMDAIITQGEATLRLTPEMLPVLKEAGVVDAGGQGLLYIFNGFRLAINGQEITDYTWDTVSQAIEEGITGSYSDVHDAQIEFGYCTEFLIHKSEGVFEEDVFEQLKTKLERIGDSIVVVGDGNLGKVHVHTDSPGVVLQFALKLGELTGIKIDNMRDQHRSLYEDSKNQKGKKPYALVAVVFGEGIENVFLDLMVDGIIQGGQTMNPSTEDISKAITEAPSDTVFVFPNNKNIILSAEQAGSMNDKKVVVVPTKSIPQGIAAILAYQAEASCEDNEAAMNEALDYVKTGQITTAVRDSKINGLSIAQGDYIGMQDGDIVNTASDVTQAACDLLDRMIDDEVDVVTVFYGADVTEQDAQKLGKHIEQAYPDCDVSILNGGQPVYQYIFSAE
jgi:DAK2 domain fusion protein YloV